MKRTFFLVLSFLAALALALPPSDAVNDDNLAISSSPQPDAQEASDLTKASIENSDGETLEEDPTTDDLLAELHRLTDTNATLSIVNSSDASISSAGDVTTASDDQFKHLKGWYRVDVRLGGKQGTHAGTFQGERMYERMYTILKSCVKGASIDDCSIRNVAYKDGAGNYRTDSTLYLDVEHSYYNPYHTDLQDLGYRMMARAYQKMTEVPKNCREASFKGTSGGSRSMKFCSVANRAMIVFPTNGGPTQLVLKVKLEWDRNTEKNTYFCEDFTESSVPDYVSVPFVKGFNEDIAKMKGWKANRVTTYTGCYYDGCFKTSSGRDLMEWQEDKDCEPRWNPIGCLDTDANRNNPALNCPSLYFGTRSHLHGEPGKRKDGNSPSWNPLNKG